MSRLTSSDHVIVVGAGLAGWRLVESLRREGFDGAVTLIGEERHPPYDRPPLSKQVLSGKWTLDKTTLASEEKLAESKASLRLGERATHLTVMATSVGLADGARVEGSHVALATGARARELRFASSGALPSLRNHDDVVHLERTLRDLPTGSVVAVIGGGFVGAEAATALTTRGLTPVVLEVAARPLLAAVGEEVSRWLEPLSGDFGVDLRTDQTINDVRPVDGGFVLDLEGGAPLRAAAVLAAAGSRLDLAWLEDSGLTLDDGVVVDRDLQAAANVAAIGDVARFRWANPVEEELVRIEHWQVATDHAAQLAHYWVHGERLPSVMVPYFWSDQYGKKIQMLGHPHPSDDVTLVSGSVDERKWLALYSREDFVTGAVALNQPRGLMLTKSLLESATTIARARDDAPWST